MPHESKYVTINGKKITFEELTDAHLEETWEDVYERNTLQFIQSWLRGEEEFTVPTSGSTGKPKEIKIARDIMEKSVKMTANALNLAEGDSSLTCINTSYIGGKMMLVRALTLGMQLTIVSPSSNPFADLKPGKHFDFMALVPLQLEILVGKDIYRKALNQAKAIIVGGAPVSEHLNQKLQVLKAPVYATYGMTETVSHIALKKLNGLGQEENFQVFEEVEIGQDKRACLTIRSVLTGGKKLITNDRVKIINNHEFRWLGRIDNVVNTGGIKVQLEELELRIHQILIGLGRNENLMVAAIDDARLGQKLTLLLEGEKKQDNELLDLMKKQLSYSSPREIKWVPEFFRTGTGKINRHLTMKKYLG